MAKDGRCFTHISRSREYSEIVYGGEKGNGQACMDIMEAQKPKPLDYKTLWGEIHGHTGLSDGTGTLEDYFTAARDEAGLDFCAVTDHDHGGIGQPELPGEKWEQTQKAAAVFYEPGRFSTLLGYERDSSPWYSNLCVYYRSGQADMLLGEHPGEISREELSRWLAREDVLLIPHHTAELRQGVHFTALPLELMTPLIEVVSKWGASEYFNNPKPIRRETRFGHWRDALEKGAVMGCVGGSDVHSPHPGMDHASGGNLRYDNPGVVAVLSTENSREAIFDALKARRCYAANGVGMEVDLRVNGAVMGDVTEQPENGERLIYARAKGTAAIKKFDLVKNGRDYISEHVDGEDQEAEFVLTDLEAERERDYYYVRLTQIDGRQAWSSPIWVQG